MYNEEKKEHVIRVQKEWRWKEEEKKIKDKC